MGIINKPLLLHLVGCLYYCISDSRLYEHQTLRLICGIIYTASNEVYPSPVFGFFTFPEIGNLLDGGSVQNWNVLQNVWYKVIGIYIYLIGVLYLWLINIELQMHGICSTSRWQDNIKVLLKRRKLAVIIDVSLTFRHRACVLCIGQAFHYSSENAFYIFNQQIYFIIWYLLDRASLI